MCAGPQELLIQLMAVRGGCSKAEKVSSSWTDLPLGCGVLPRSRKHFGGHLQREGPIKHDARQPRYEAGDFVEPAGAQVGDRQSLDLPTAAAPHARLSNLQLRSRLRFRLPPRWQLPSKKSAFVLNKRLRMKVIE